MAPVIQIHQELNPRLWQHNELRPLVRLKLFQAAIAFYKFLDVDELSVPEIILTGSNAAYNYTKLSDIDVHLIVDFRHTTCPKLADNFFTTKKALWSETYDVSIFGMPVELYVEDEAKPVKASGVFSILHNRWLIKPSHQRPTIDHNAIRLKRDEYAAKIEGLLTSEPTIKDVDGLIARLRRLRQNGLERNGEWAVENCTYKVLRDEGFIEQLYNKRVELRDRELSL